MEIRTKPLMNSMQINGISWDELYTANGVLILFVEYPKINTIRELNINKNNSNKHKQFCSILVLGLYIHSDRAEDRACLVLHILY